MSIQKQIKEYIIRQPEPKRSKMQVLNERIHKSTIASVRVLTNRKR